MVASVLACIEKKDCQKAVLARSKRVIYKQAVDSLSLLERFIALRENSYLFYIRLAADEAFICRSPERLVAVDHGNVEIDAIAGTRPRDSDPQRDQFLGLQLLQSTKDRHEQAIVSRHVNSRLDACCHAHYSDPQPSLLHLRHVQHLLTRHSGQLKAGVSALALADKLHPTPAIGGMPCDPALALISELESFDRGWFAGGVGWISHASLELAVAIRCGLVRDNVLHLFAGCGIVEGSIAELEWQEAEYKMQSFMAAMNVLPEDENRAKLPMGSSINSIAAHV